MGFRSFVIRLSLKENVPRMYSCIKISVASAILAKARTRTMYIWRRLKGSVATMSSSPPRGDVEVRAEKMKRAANLQYTLEVDHGIEHSHKI